MGRKILETKKQKEENEKMLIKFSKRFYSPKAIKNSAQAYQGLAKFDIKKDKDGIKVKITDIDQDVKNILKDEFCNYVLSETVKQKRARD